MATDGELFARSQPSTSIRSMQLQQLFSVSPSDQSLEPHLGPDGLEILYRARCFSLDTRSDKWDFAVEIGELRKLNLTSTDFRWLIRKGYVEHACEMTLQGEAQRTFRAGSQLTFSDRSAFILTEEGAAYFQAAAPVHLTPGIPPTANGEVSTSSIPNWNADLRELTLDSKIVKQFKWPAPNQEIILDTFQLEGWRQRIDDPLSPQPNQDPKRRLNDTIKNLNQKQQQAWIRFRGDGSGEAITWEQVKSNVFSTNGNR